MFTKHLIDKVLITLEVGDKTPLFILLEKRGTVHRKGNGGTQGPDLPLMQGISHAGHFDALMMTVDENIFDYAGVLKFPDRVGRECRLTLIFNSDNGEVDYSFRVVYGEQSQGPPMELAQILINAVKITDPWYYQQVEEAKKEEEKGWWKFWK
ncbi:MAG: hypothetical protein U0V74_15660 [Chitinophagales bacterium]